MQVFDLSFSHLISCTHSNTLTEQFITFNTYTHYLTIYQVGINSNYQLVIVGHSLGAAVAAVLSLFLRTRYPNLKCLGYGMPASVFDWQTSQGRLTLFLLIQLVLLCLEMQRIRLHGILIMLLSFSSWCYLL